MARALGQMAKQEGQGLGLEKGWGGASVSPENPNFSFQPLLLLLPHPRNFGFRLSIPFPPVPSLYFSLPLASFTPQ